MSYAKLNTLYNAVVAYLLGYRRPLLYIEVLEYVAGKYKPIIESGVCPWCGGNTVTQAA